MIGNDNSLNITSHTGKISLLSAYPNPFNPVTNVIFSLAQGSNSIISVYDIGGRYLETLSKSYYSPGTYTLTWSATKYPSGIYLVRLDNDFTTLIQKLILTK